MSGHLLSEKINHDGPKVYYNERFRNVIEFHLDILKRKFKTVQAEIPPAMAMRHHYNFYGILNELGIKPNLHWIILRLNGMTSPMEYRQDKTSILIPDQSDIDVIRTTYTTTHKIT